MGSGDEAWLPDLPSPRVRAVLESALTTFARSGYRRTSMDEVARNADISRPGLYLHFPSKQHLLRAAVGQALAEDVVRAEEALAQPGPLRPRLLEALDHYGGRYVGPLAVDLDRLIDQDAALLADLRETWSKRFAGALDAAVAAAPELARVSGSGQGVAATRDVVLALLSGTKRQAADRDDFRDRLQHGLVLLIG